MDKKYDITTVGMVNVNMSVTPVGAHIFEQDVTLIDPVSLSPGGDAMNEALTAARLSNSVAIVGKAGEDIFAQFICAELKKAGVEEKYLRIEKGKKTAIGLMLIGEDGNRNICAYRGAFESLCLGDIDFYPIQNSRFVNIGSMLALKDLDGAGVREILKRAKKSGAVTSADTKQDTYGIGFDGIRSCFEYLDYFLPSYQEALYLSRREKPEEQAEFFLRYGCKGVVIKLGEKGCYFHEREKGGKYVPACPAKSVDTSGAGDNFVAGFLTGLKKGFPMEEAVRFGNAVAAVSIEKYGSSGVVESVEQVERHRRICSY